MFTVYRIIGPDGRGYVGCTSQTPEFRFYEQSLRAARGYRLPRGSISEAIRKHGPDAFEVETICEIASSRLAAMVEARMIERLGTRRPHGFNLMGSGFPVAKFAEAA